MTQERGQNQTNLSQGGALMRRKEICLANPRERELEASKCWAAETGATAESQKQQVPDSLREKR